MSESTQAIFFFIGFLGCLLASFSNYWGATPTPGWRGFHPGWLGLASALFVFFWVAVKAS
jgi:hypothetical protein